MNAGLLLIAVGVLFLLNTTGVVSWAVWDNLWRLWPLVLVAVGLDLMFGRNPKLRVPLLVVVLGLAVVLSLFFRVTESRSPQSEQVSYPINGATQAQITLEPSVGRLVVEGTNDPNVLLEGTVELLPGEVLEREVAEGPGVLSLALRSKGQVRSGRDADWNLEISQNLPIQLKVNTGVGDVDLELEELQLQSIELQAGVGQVKVRLPKGNIVGNLVSGVGGIRVQLPNAPVRLEVVGGLGQVEVPRGVERLANNVYQSPDYDGASERISLRLQAGVGSIEVTR